MEREAHDGCSKPLTLDSILLKSSAMMGPQLWWAAAAAGQRKARTAWHSRDGERRRTPESDRVNREGATKSVDGERPHRDQC